ncbi:hypothetical protein DFQ29_010224 [Apophysomyces sp. BC1021]|nr:hypothetical protein DFQ29_010224 [Apophysomyces sp. BC1021]
MLSPHSDTTVDARKIYDDSPATIEADIDLTGQSTSQAAPPRPLNFTPPATPDTSTVTGSINREQPQQPEQHSMSSLGDTLDEPVSVTILRDLKQVANKVKQVLHPQGDRNVLRDWN